MAFRSTRTCAERRRAMQSLGNTTPNATLVASYKPSNTFAITGSVSYDDVRHPYQRDARPTTAVLGSSPMPRHRLHRRRPAHTPTNGEGTTSERAYILPEYVYFSDVVRPEQDDRRDARRDLEPLECDHDEPQSGSIRTIGTRPPTIRTRSASTDRARPRTCRAAALRASMPMLRIRSTRTVSCSRQRSTCRVRKRRPCSRVNSSDANNLQWHTAYDDGGPLTATFDVSYSRATSNLKAAQQDIEHGYYSANGQTASAAPTAPGCNNFAASCAAGTGNPAIQVQWTNGGTSGLPTAQYIGAYADVLSNPDYALFKSAWAWANQYETGSRRHQRRRGLQAWLPRGRRRQHHGRFPLRYARRLADLRPLPDQRLGRKRKLHLQLLLTLTATGRGSTTRIRATRPFRMTRRCPIRPWR